MIDLGDGEVEVVVSFQDSRLRLTSGGEEIGDWESSMYRLSRADPRTFVLSAEGDDLPFRPNLPDEFAIAAMNRAVGAPVLASPMSAPDVLEQAPPAKPLTLVLFYLLAAATVGMAVWALTSIIS